MVAFEIMGGHLFLAFVILYSFDICLPREIHDSDSEAYITGACPAKSVSYFTGGFDL